MNNTAFADKVFDMLLQIPKGHVVTYGQLAALIGHPGASRAVGNVLHNNLLPDVFPCFRVVNAQGRLAKRFGAGGIAEHKRRLLEDGIEVKENCVDLDRYQWQKF